jgi:hypothetical protein
MRIIGSYESENPSSRPLSIPVENFAPALTCGNPSCICQRDPERLHGPHLYITYRVDGKSRSLYVPPEHATTARQAQQAWADFWEIGCSLAALNREQLRRQWQQERKKRKPLTGRRDARD